VLARAGLAASAATTPRRLGAGHEPPPGRAPLAALGGE
jgi:hypothetical protein